MEVRRFSGAVFAIISLCALTPLSGCFESGETALRDEGISPYDLREVRNNGIIQAFAQAMPDTVTQEIHYEVSQDKVVNITITATVTDDDDGTDPDSVDLVRMWMENGDAPDDAVEMEGGQTPFTCSHHFELTGEESLTTWWIVELTVTCYGGSDQWPGPVIWRGTPDNGIAYDILYNFTAYVPPVDLET